MRREERQPIAGTMLHDRGQTAVELVEDWLGEGAIKPEEVAVQVATLVGIIRAWDPVLAQLTRVDGKRNEGGG